MLDRPYLQGLLALSSIIFDILKLKHQKMNLFSFGTILLNVFHLLLDSMTIFLTFGHFNNLLNRFGLFVSELKADIMHDKYENFNI